MRRKLYDMAFQLPRLLLQPSKKIHGSFEETRQTTLCFALNLRFTVSARRVASTTSPPTVLAFSLSTPIPLSSNLKEGTHAGFHVLPNFELEAQKHLLSSCNLKDSYLFYVFILVLIICPISTCERPFTTRFMPSCSI